jgi:catechol 2,3-dioxygenase-like lactoylglutathione lyase family enzyme
VDVKLEVVVLPVSDVDRAKQFYKGLGWREDADIVGGADFRIVQLTPPGSSCSIAFGTGVTTVPPGRSRDCCSSRRTSRPRAPSTSSSAPR